MVLSLTALSQQQFLEYQTAEHWVSILSEKVQQQLALPKARCYFRICSKRLRRNNKYLNPASR